MASGLTMAHEGRLSPRLRECADALRAMVLASPEDTLIGRESDLRQRLGCNQAMLRQIARQLEVQGLLYIRRGASGGYFGSRPSAEMVVDMAAIYMLGRGVTLDATLLACRSSTVYAARVAAERSMDSRHRPEMERLYAALKAKIPEDTGCAEFVFDEGLIDDAIFVMIEIPPLELFIKMLNRFSLQEFGSEMFERQPERRRSYRALRLKTLNYILNGDADGAAKAMEQVIELIYKWLPKAALLKVVGEISG